VVASAAACGGSASSASPPPHPYTARTARDAFRKVGVQTPVVLRYGKSCDPETWPVPQATQSTKVAKLYACGKLADAGISTTNLPSAVLLVRGFAVIPNYLIMIYPDLKHAASTDFWLKGQFVPGKGGRYEYGPLSVLRKGNLVVSGFMRQSEIDATNRVFDTLKNPKP